MQFNAQCLGSWTRYQPATGNNQPSVPTENISSNQNEANTQPTSENARNEAGNNNFEANISNQPPLPWALHNSYQKGQIVEYKSQLYQAVSDFGNLSKPDDLCSKAIYEIFNFPSRSFAYLHILYGLLVFFYMIFTLFQRRGHGVYLSQLLASFLLMFFSFRASQSNINTKKIEPSQASMCPVPQVRGYAFTNQLRQC